jgi:membrane protein
MNPRRGSFLYQAAAIMLLLVLVLTFLLLSGPPSKLEDKTELAGAIFLIPTLLTTFAAKDSEHELMSQMLSFGRICVVVASILSVMAGLLVFSVYATKHSLHFRWIAFLALMMALLTSAFTLYLFIFQVIRIYAMRRAVQDRVNHYDSSGIIYNSIEGDPEEERRFIIFRDSAIACTVLMVAGALAIGFFGSGRLLTIWQLLSP